MAKEKIKNSYLIRRRFFSQDGKPKDWECTGQGQWIDSETVQKQIRLLLSNYTHHKIEIEIIKDENLVDVNGNVINQSLMFERK
jgi:predicted transcriptional regulator